MTSRPHKNHLRGAATVEFTLVGIPLIFVLISIFEISRGMWVYETVAHAVREGARYAAVHGQDCAVAPNTCSINISNIAQKIQNAGVGLDAAQFSVTVSVNLGASTVSLTSSGAQTLQAFLTGGAGNQSFSNWTYVSSGSNVSAASPGNDVIVSGEMPFYSALSMFAPGSRKVTFATTKLVATSQERILF